MRISRFYQTGLIFKTAAIFLLALSSVASAIFILLLSNTSVAFAATYLSSADCRAHENREYKAWRREYDAQAQCWAVDKCRNPGLEPRFKEWSQTLSQICEICSQMAANERQLAQQEEQNRNIQLRQQETQARQQRESQQRLQLSQQQYQRSQQAEAQQRANTARRYEQEQQQARQQAAQARTDRMNATGNAVMGMLNAFMPKPKYDDGDDYVAPVYKRTEPVKEQLQQYAMPGGKDGVAATVQNESLKELRRYHEQIGKDFKDTMTQIETFDAASSGTSSRSSSSSTFKPSTSLPVNTGANPWEADSSSKAETAISTATSNATSNDNPWANDSTGKTEAASSSVGTSRTTEVGRTANASSDNPWANDSANNYAETAQTGSNGYVQLARADADNPWDTPPASSGGSKCDDIRAGKVKFKWDWSDKKGRRCFSNASKRANAAGGEICCSW